MDQQWVKYKRSETEHILDLLTSMLNDLKKENLLQWKGSFLFLKNGLGLEEERGFRGLERERENPISFFSPPLLCCTTTPFYSQFLAQGFEIK